MGELLAVRGGVAPLPRGHRIGFAAVRASAIVLALAALLAACGGGGSPTSQSGLMRVPLGDSPQRGPSDPAGAWVTIVEFSDFQCPYCGAAEPTVEQILANNPDARLVYKHFPLSQHANARPAANAAECARAQGHFWEMHDLLFAHQTALDAAALASYAGQINGLDTVAWQTCFDAKTYDDRVTADLTLGQSVGVQGTPTFAINGEPLVGAQPLAAFQAAVDAARAAAIASGIPRAQYYDKAVLGN